MKIQKPIIGQKVLLCRYRKVRGKVLSDDKLDELRTLLIGKEGVIVQINENQNDSSGCRIVWVEVEGKQLTWRLASLKKIRKRPYRPMK